MYPNPQDALPLPPRPDLDHYRKRAKQLLEASRSNDATAIGEWAARWVEDLVALQPESERALHTRDASRRVEQVTTFATERLGKEPALSQAQFVIARSHGFTSWPSFVQHLEALHRASSPISAFERAADAIVGGDLFALTELLKQDPALVRARSGREHNATLLHYVSANGVEGYRQRTPANIVAIARHLLDAGAAVNAEADVYGGGATTLGLVVTSTPPRKAGVQNALADLFIERGARVDPGVIRGCLANGCPEAAAHLAARGAPVVDLEEAAGIGRLDLVERFLLDAGRTPSARERWAALIMASWYDHRDAIAFLLDHGVDPGIRSPEKGEGRTALHIAAYQGYVELVELLLRRNAPVNVVDDTYGTPPLVWAMHGWLVEGRGPAERYRAILRMLVEHGAEVRAPWLEDERLRADAELFAMLARRVV